MQTFPSLNYISREENTHQSELNFCVHFTSNYTINLNQVFQHMHEKLTYVFHSNAASRLVRELTKLKYKNSRVLTVKKNSFELRCNVRYI